MKKINYLIIALAMFFVGCDNNEDNPVTFIDHTVSMGSNSIEDVYFSMSEGEVSSINRTEWDLAFSVPLQTAAILINEDAGVELYCVGDTNDWNIIDENSIDGLQPRYNDESDWTKGAFNVNSTGFPNYGWGTYHAGFPDHNVGGDSIYVIKLTDNTFKKFMVRAKVGATSANVLRWADLDGNNEVVVSFSTAPYVKKKHLIHYSIVNHEVVEAEPEMNTWDLLFTRYKIKIPTGPGTFMDYSVTGVLCNPNVSVSKVIGHPDEVTPGTFSDAANVIGSDWKAVDMQTMVTSIVDSVNYFIQSVDSTTYQLYFTEYDGLSAGTIDFKVKSVE